MSSFVQTIRKKPLSWERSTNYRRLVATVEKVSSQLASSDDSATIDRSQLVTIGLEVLEQLAQTIPRTVAELKLVIEREILRRNSNSIVLSQATTALVGAIGEAVATRGLHELEISRGW